MTGFIGCVRKAVYFQCQSLLASSIFSSIGANLDAFRRNYLNADSWELRKDGPPLQLLDSLSDDERAIAEDELIRRIHSGDDWPIRGLGHLRSVKALPELKGILNDSKPALQAIIAHAIWKISEDPGIIPVILKASQQITNWQELIDLIYLLPDFHDPRTDALLAVYRDHAEYLVAYNATRASGLSTDEVVRRFQRSKSG